MKQKHGDTTRGATEPRRLIAGASEIERPADLSADVAAEWDRVTALIAEVGVLDKVDCGLIRVYCETSARRAEAVRLASQLPEMYVTNPNGSIGLHPLYKMIDKNSDQLARWGELLFLSPASRIRHGLNAAPQPTAAETFGESLRVHAMNRPEVPKVEPLEAGEGDEETGETEMH